MEKFLPRQPRLRHNTPGWVENPEYFITICCHDCGRNQLCYPHISRNIFDALKFYHQKKLCRAELLVLMPDHLHAIVRIAETIEFASWVAGLKRWIARTTKVCFQENFFDHRLRSDSSAVQKWNYVIMNPVRADLVKHPKDWPYSFTLHDFEGR